jgi:hypothetical protein
VNYGFPHWPAMVVAMVTTGGIAYLIGYPALKLQYSYGGTGAVHGGP